MARQRRRPLVGVCAVTGALLLALWAVFAPGGAPQEEPKMSDRLETQVDRALALDGEEYRQAEAGLRRDREAAGSLLGRETEDHPDPFARFVARAILELPEDEQVFEEVEEFLARTERRLTGTIVGGPRPDVVAEDLSHLYGRRLVGYFAVRLVKEDAEWPAWKTEGVLLYLAEEGRAEIVPALIRYASISDDPHLRRLAVDTVGRFPDEAPDAWAQEARYWHLKAAAARREEP